VPGDRNDSWNALDLSVNLEDLQKGSWEVRSPGRLSLGGDVYSSPGQLLVSILNVNHSHGTLIAKNPPFPYLLLECLGPVEEGRLL
jgi:hypothetical protein